MSLPCPMCEKPQDGSPTGCPCSYEDLEGALRAAKAELAEASAKSAQTIAWLERRVQREMAKPDDAYAVQCRELLQRCIRHLEKIPEANGLLAEVKDAAKWQSPSALPLTGLLPGRMCPQAQRKCVGYRCTDKCFVNPDICTSNLPSADEQLTERQPPEWWETNRKDLYLEIDRLRADNRILAARLAQRGEQGPGIGEGEPSGSGDGGGNTARIRK